MWSLCLKLFEMIILKNNTLGLNSKVQQPQPLIGNYFSHIISSNKNLHDYVYGHLQVTFPFDNNFF